MEQDFRTNVLTIDHCVLGSGIGGLSIAAELEAAGADYLVLDKGRTPGGRAATRRFAESRFDHGLPLISEQGPATRKLVDEGVRRGVLSETELAEGESGWFAPAGISALGKNLANGLKVRNRVRVTSIESDPEGLTLIGDSDLGQTRVNVRESLLVTAPLPQALALLAPLEPGWTLPDRSPYDKCVVAMVKVDADRKPDDPVIRDLESGAGSLVLDYLKFADVEPGVSLRFNPEISTELFDKEDQTIKQIVARELDPLFGALASDGIQLMKWRYATGSGAVNDEFLSFTREGVRIAVCGDAFLGGSAFGTEATLLSCRAALGEVI